MPFREEAFLRACQRVYELPRAPDFAALPDIVAGGPASLELSMSWRPRLSSLAPLYLVVQDGMTEQEVAACCAGITGIFVGGSLGWKLRTAEAWVRFAHARGLLLHIGRCGTADRVRWARRIGADSIDSSLPLWSEENLQRFLSALAPSSQMELIA